MKDLLQLIGKSGFAVIVKNVRQVYNRVDVLVSPKAGAGETWISRHKLTIEE